MIAIIDYNAGNVRSVANALDRFKVDYVITSDPKEIRCADKIIFPGQGRAGQAMRVLQEKGLIKIIKNTKVPFLGICLGLQLLADYSEEDNTVCLGIIPGKVVKFINRLKLPQIGWNCLKIKEKNLFLKNISDNQYVYFVNSYYLKTKTKYIMATSQYGVEFPAVIQKDNFYATQFHPEKSGEIGLKILKNFCEL